MAYPAWLIVTTPLKRKVGGVRPNVPELLYQLRDCGYAEAMWEFFPSRRSDQYH